MSRLATNEACEAGFAREPRPDRAGCPGDTLPGRRLERASAEADGGPAGPDAGVGAWVPWLSRLRGSPGEGSRAPISPTVEIGLTERAPRAEAGTGQVRREPPVALVTPATIFCETASMSASVRVASMGCRRTAIAIDFLPGPICASALGPAKTSKTVTASISALSAARAARSTASASTRSSRTKAKSRSTGCRSETWSGGRVVPRAFGNGSASSWRVKATAGPRTSRA